MKDGQRLVAEPDVVFAGAAVGGGFADQPACLVVVVEGVVASGLANALAERVEAVGGGDAGDGDAGQAAARVVGEGLAGPVGGEAAVGVGGVGLGLAAGDGRQAVAGRAEGVAARGGAAGLAQAVAGGVVAVAVGDAGQDGLGQPVEGVVAVARGLGGVAELALTGKTRGAVVGDLPGLVGEDVARRPAIGVLAPGEALSGAVGELLEGAAGVVGDGAGERLDLTASGEPDFADLPLGVEAVVDLLAARRGEAGQAAVGVAVVGGEGDAGDLAGFLGQASVRVVLAVDGGEQGVGGVALFDVGEASLAVGPLVPEEEVAAVVGIGAVGEAVEGVVLTEGRLALGVGVGQFVAGGVEGPAADAAVGGVEAGGVAQAVDGVARGEVSRVGDAAQAVLSVVGVLGEAATWIGDPDQAVEGVEGLGAAAGAGTVRGGEVALRIVGVVGLELVERAEFAGQAAERVMDALAGLAEDVGGVAPFFFDAIADGVEGIGEGVAEGVGDLREAVGGVVGVGEEAAIGWREAGELAGWVVGVGGVFVADGLAGEAAARVVGEGGDEAVRVDQGERPAVQVVGGEVAALPEGIGDAGELAAFAGVGVGGVVVGVGGEVGDVGARAVGGEDLADAVVGPGPGARAADQGGGEALAAVGVGGGLFVAREEVAGGVVGEGGALEGFGDTQRQAPGGMPFGAGGARVGGAGGFDALGFEVAAVVGVEGEVAVEVGLAQEVAVAGVVGEAAGEPGNEGLADRRDAAGAEEVLSNWYWVTAARGLVTVLPVILPVASF